MVNSRSRKYEAKFAPEKGGCRCPQPTAVSGQKVRQKSGLSQKDVKNEGRPGNVYENKGTNDKMPEIKPDICAWSDEFLQKKTAL